MLTIPYTPVVAEKKLPDNKKAKRQAQQYELVTYLIDLKKTKRQRSKQLSLLFFSIGLVISLSLVVMLFEWKSYDRGELVELADTSANFEELLDIPPTEQLPPPPPVKVIQQPNIIEVKTEEEIEEEIKIDFDIDITTDEAMTEVDYSAIAMDQPEEEPVEEIFTIVESMPQPKMGMDGFMSYLYENINYPQAALRARVQGRVFVQFIINKDGTLSDFVIVKGIGMGCDEEAVRVLSQAEPWHPGKQRGVPVKIRMVLPINFVYKPR